MNNIHFTEADTTLSDFFHLNLAGFNAFNVQLALIGGGTFEKFLDFARLGHCSSPIVGDNQGRRMPGCGDDFKVIAGKCGSIVVQELCQSD